MAAELAHHDDAATSCAGTQRRLLSSRTPWPVNVRHFSHAPCNRAHAVTLGTKPETERPGDPNAQGVDERPMIVRRSITRGRTRWRLLAPLQALSEGPRAW